MARINNSQVIQKLIDELKLYPSKDAIPTELAEKILPVFQINSEEVTVNIPPANIVRADNVTSATSTLYTTPSTGKFYLTNASLHCICADSGVNAIATGEIIITPKDSSAVNILEIALRRTAALAGEVVGVANASNFQNAIELEPNSVISLTGGTNVNAVGSIVGYTEAD